MIASKFLCHKEAQKTQIGFADFLSLLCLFAAKDKLQQYAKGAKENSP